MTEQQGLGITLDGDEWVGHTCAQWEIHSPSADDVCRSLARLDQARYSCVTLSSKDGTQMTIGGGGGRYICFYTDAASSFWSLVAGPVDRAQKVSLTIGGQAGDYPASHVVSYDLAMKAALAFAVGESRSPSMDWVIDNGE